MMNKKIVSWLSCRKFCVLLNGLPLCGYSHAFAAPLSILAPPENVRAPAQQGAPLWQVQRGSLK